MKYLWLFSLAILSAALYRIGGKGGFPNAKLIRRMGIPIACYIPACVILFGPGGWLWYILSAGLLALALSTYHDYLAPDGVSENWLCWLVTGLCYGLASLPLVWGGIHIYAIFGRAITLAVLTMWASERTGKVFWEETLRGFLVIATLPTLLI